ncbi:nuclease [Labedella populi]|uniref:Nuclease n=1 Tax=Labedella populi TaxID=2498850 RepID=A0A3S4E7I5_9MICO|nr:thermonuclease family protein [Labedella populi]RWZ68077.1 nuclease [Labedella populi]
MSVSRRRRAASTFLIALMLGGITACTPAPSDQASTVEAEEGEVVAVVDGDTIDVQLPDGEARIRIIGIDTPEIAREPGETSDCYADEARTSVNDLLYGRTVELRSDPTQDDVDRYGRLLRHVLVDGKSAAVLALGAGVGHEYTYDADYDGQAAHREAEKSAASHGVGLWSACS